MPKLVLAVSVAGVLTACGGGNDAALRAPLVVPENLGGFAPRTGDYA